MRSLAGAILALLVLALGAGPAAALSSDWLDHEQARVRLIAAGGETSGAVVSALGVRGLRIGAPIDPGVPWCLGLGEPPVALALKSGNFGTEDFFTKALRALA